MIKLIAIAALAATVAGATSASASGRLDAPEPVVRNYSIHMEIEPGYLSKADIAADIRGGGRADAN
ncbi:hypothetical protein [Brucella anthropi]|uniref:hypothetical protein n=1 Tax=Brucella anthropi TaxID=529 RepID=UPI00215836A2|nr:hypothetical protein [Brucella anthropi]MCR8493706.1 hypothetical protein [Brucella anthropi]